ncbi:NAD-dependent succinate-semialdehyde dehydrogenase [Lichenicoccus sp.]|uniref:NAD-dependent succinate-semialdehyde dehydrogenase n=1 Tax=Lichenicoccus sp. TaxID=2781899 RepID=UPI003D10C585
MSEQTHDAGEGAQSRNPATGAIIERFAFADTRATNDIMDAAQSGFEAWRAVPPADRAPVLQRFAANLRAQEHAIALTITAEMGKTLAESRAEVAKCASQADWYAERGPALLSDERAPVETHEVSVSYRPTGLVLGIMPWNFPLWQAVRAAVPILLGGNGFLLKPAPNVMRSALTLAACWNEAGAPNGLFAVLNIGHHDIERIIHDPRICGVTLTGSPRAGAAVASLAGAALKPSVLELGGSDPFIVLADADLDSAVAAGIASRFGNCGQVCIAAKRFLLERSIAGAFTERFIAAARALAVGDPTHPETRMGPMARADLRDELHRQVADSVHAGARLSLGGHAIEGPGNFYAPTVLERVRPGMVAFDAETFGPLAALTVVDDADEAVALANTSAYGLGGNLWTADLARARTMARALHTGGVFINGTTASDPRWPIGGVGRSGYGRELSHFGLRSFLNAQVVSVRPPPSQV